MGLGKGTTVILCAAVCAASPPPTLTSAPGARPRRAMRVAPARAATVQAMPSTSLAVARLCQAALAPGRYCAGECAFAGGSGGRPHRGGKEGKT